MRSQQKYATDLASTILMLKLSLITDSFPSALHNLIKKTGEIFVTGGSGLSKILAWIEKTQAIAIISIWLKGFLGDSLALA